MYFDEWKTRINNILEDNTGLGCDSLIDIDYQSLFESNHSPLEVAQMVVDKEFGRGAPTLREEV